MHGKASVWISGEGKQGRAFSLKPRSLHRYLYTCVCVLTNRGRFPERSAVGSRLFSLFRLSGNRPSTAINKRTLLKSRQWRHRLPFWLLFNICRLYWNEGNCHRHAGRRDEADEETFVCGACCLAAILIIPRNKMSESIVQRWNSFHLHIYDSDES